VASLAVLLNLAAHLPFWGVAVAGAVSRVGCWPGQLSALIGWLCPWCSHIYLQFKCSFPWNM